MVYTPRFKKQLTGTKCAGANCNMASAAMLADRMTLGVINVTPDYMRLLSETSYRCTDGISGNDGTSQADALRALGKLGLFPKAYSNYDVVKLRESFARGMILSINYSAVPYALKGDKNFNGRHAIYMNKYNDTKRLVQRGDPLCDHRRSEIPKDFSWVDAAVYEKAAEAYYDGAGNIYCIVNVTKYATPKTDWCNVRPSPSRSGSPIYKLTKASGVKLEAGQKVVTGESIGGNNKWWKVWVNTLNRAGYIHDSVVSIC